MNVFANPMLLGSVAYPTNRNFLLRNEDFEQVPVLGSPNNAGRDALGGSSIRPACPGPS